LPGHWQGHGYAEEPVIVRKYISITKGRSLTISAGYSQVIPNQPKAKKVLKTNKNTAAAIPGLLSPSKLVVMAKTIIEIDIPAAPINISGRRPTFSIMKMGIRDARKYSVPLQAARIRDVKPSIPMDS
jgi:hypothetical protein